MRALTNAHPPTRPVTATVVAAIIAASAALTGCATGPAEPCVDQPLAAPLYCKGKSECDLYWKRAELFVRSHSQYAMRVVRDDVILTEGPYGAKIDPAFRVQKVPRGDALFEIEMRSTCANMFGCQPSPAALQVEFKRFVVVGSGEQRSIWERLMPWGK
jgi:hypothetical protein